MRPLQSVIAGVLFAVSLTPNLAFAGKKGGGASSPGNSALAEGRRLMAAGNYSEACPKIADSESQSPAPVTALTLGICWEKAGKLASAWSAYKAAVDVASGAHQKKSEVAAQHGVTRLEPKLSRITIKLAERPSGVEVRRDGDVVPDSDMGAAIPLDGGGHDVEVSAPGKKPWRKHVDLAESGQSLAIEVPALESDTPAPAAATQETPPASEPEKGSSRGQVQRIAGFAVVGVGVLGLALGVVAGVEAKSTYDDALSKCGGHPSCPPGSPGLSERNTAGTWATVSDVAFIAGGAAVVGGVVLYLTAPRGSVPTVGLAPAARGTGLSLVGRF